MERAILPITSKNTQDKPSLSIEIPPSHSTKVLASKLNRINFGPGQDRIKICYGLELAASELQKGNVSKCEECLLQVRTLVLKDIPSLSVEYASYALDMSIDYKIRNNTDLEQLFVKLLDVNYSVIDFIERENGPRSKFLSIRGQCNLVDCLKGIHDALTAIRKSDADPQNPKSHLDKLAASIVYAYKAIQPSSRKMREESVLEQMIKEI